MANIEHHAGDANSDRAFHPLANLFPLLEGVEFEELVADIKANGLHECIVLLDDQILDGRNRYRACLEAGVEPTYRQLQSDNPLAFVISLNLRRRHLDESRRAMVASKIAAARQGERTDLRRSANLQKVDRATAAKMLNVSERTVASAAKVLQHGSPEIQCAVEKGQMSVSAAAKIANLPVEDQVEAARAASAKRIRQVVEERGDRGAATRWHNKATAKREVEKRSEKIAIEFERLATTLIGLDAEAARTLHTALWEDDRRALRTLKIALDRGLAPPSADERTPQVPITDPFEIPPMLDRSGVGR